ncbi:hypothetical protein [Streptomyces sp. NPDC093225]|uniref:hypothetical protein n=1 Tax=Streptomyces sp. NPDC093225 TaxID=3366034 RepID=UPI0038270AD2
MTTPPGPAAPPGARHAPVAALSGAYWLDSPSRHEGEDCGRCDQLRRANAALVRLPGPSERRERPGLPPQERGAAALRVVMTILAVLTIASALAVTGLGD